MHCHKAMRSLQSLRDKVLKPAAGPLVIDSVVTAISIDSESAHFWDLKVAEINEAHQEREETMQSALRSSRDELQRLEAQSTEKALSLQRELNKSAEKYLKSQQEVVR